MATQSVLSCSNRCSTVFPDGVNAVSGKVRVAWHKLTGQRVAVKTYEKAKIKVRSRLYCVSFL